MRVEAVDVKVLIGVLGCDRRCSTYRLPRVGGLKPTMGRPQAVSATGGGWRLYPAAAPLSGGVGERRWISSRSASRSVRAMNVSSASPVAVSDTSMRAPPS
jgi:hypothetical protein